MTNVTPHGSAGPWTGEVVNSGSQTVYGVAATARLLDDAGNEVYPGRLGILACPSKLLPGERGAYEFFEASPDYPTPSMPLAQAKPPLRAEFDALAHDNVGTGQARGDGLLVTLVTRDAAHNTAIVKLTNNSDGSYRQFTVCGIVRDKSGHVVSVGRADGPVAYTLDAGRSIDLTVPFDVPPDGELRFHALGLLTAQYVDCCPLGASTWHPADTGPFSVLLPPGWEYARAQGIDSFVGSFAGDGVTLTFDYGMYGGGPSPGDPTLTAHDETIGGYSAHLFFPKLGGVSRSGIFVRTLDSSPPFGYPVALVLSGSGLTPDQQEVALQIFRSLRFKP